MDCSFIFILCKHETQNSKQGINFKKRIFSIFLLHILVQYLSFCDVVCTDKQCIWNKIIRIIYKKHNIETHVSIFESSFHWDHVGIIATVFKTMIAH